MKKLSLFLIIGLFFSQFISAQETVIYYPDFKFDVGYGFTKQHVDFNAGQESELWKRVGATPDNVTIGADTLTRPADLRAIKCAGYTKTDIYKTNTYAIVDKVDLGAYPSSNDFFLSFFTKAQYQKGTNGAKLNVLLSTDYTDDATTATWQNVVSELDTIDQPKGYDSKFTKSTLSLNAYKGATVTLAFQYLIEADGLVESTPDAAGKDSVSVRPGSWVISDVKFYATAPSNLDTIAQNHFNYFSLFQVVNMTSANNQTWERKSQPDNGAVSPTDTIDGNEYRAISASAVYEEGSFKNVSPTETWAVLKSIDCSGHSDVSLSFLNISQYMKGGDSNLSIKISTNYTPLEGDSVTAVNNATWEDITDQFTLDASLPYDANWTKSESVITLANDTSVTFAFVYTCTNTVTDANGANIAERASTWKICDVMVKGIPQTPSHITNNKQSTASKVYPNPSTGIINFAAEVKTIEVYTLQGQLILQKSTPTQQLNLSMLPKGMYFIKANNNTISRIILE